MFYVVTSTTRKYGKVVDDSWIPGIESENNERKYNNIYEFLNREIKGKDISYVSHDFYYADRASSLCIETTYSEGYCPIEATTYQIRKVKTYVKNNELCEKYVRIANRTDDLLRMLSSCVEFNKYKDEHIIADIEPIHELFWDKFGEH